MAATMIYMFALLALGCGMVVLMFGLSSTHGSMYTLQASFDEHEKLFLKFRETDRQANTQITSLQKAVEALRGSQESLKASSDEQPSLISRSTDSVKQQVTSQVDQLKKDIADFRDQIQAASSTLSVRVADTEQQLTLLTKQQTLLTDTVSEHGKVMESYDKALQAHAQVEQEFKGLLSDLRQRLEDTQRQAAAALAATAPPSAFVAAPASSLATATTGLPSPLVPLPATEPPRSSRARGIQLTSRADGQHSPSPPELTFEVSWYRECGCTGMEIEAVTLLVALVQRIGSHLVKTNRCTESCAWSAQVRRVLDLIEVQEDSQLTDMSTSTRVPGGRTPMLILVVHAAFNGVCGIPDSLLLPARTPEDPVSDPQRGIIRVSRTMLETDRLDEVVVRTCNNEFDAIWVPSQFNIRTFSDSGVNRSKLHVVHEAVDTTIYNCSSLSNDQHVRSKAFGLPELERFIAESAGPSNFLFLSIFKWEARKNWRGLLQGFQAAFPTNNTQITLDGGFKTDRNVRLLIKTQELSWGSSSPGEDFADFLRGLDADLRQSFRERVLVVKDSLPTEAMAGLYRVADAFVLPTHGEGWGLPIMEAMASGLPTIATNWGGQTEFMTPGNSFLLPYDMISADSVDSHMWAEPKMPDFQQVMLDVVRGGPLSQEKAQKGCQDVHEHFTPAAAATQALDIISQLLTSAPR